MDADRGAVLTVRAAVRGVVDFSKARVHDVSWWRRTNALIQAMDRDDEATTVRAAFDYQRSLVGNSGLTDESFKKSQETARELFQELVNAAKPWQAVDSGKLRDQQMQGLIDMYKQFIGDPDDPEFQKKLEHDYQLLKQRAVEEKPENDEQRIERLMREREAYYATRGRKPQ